MKVVAGENRRNPKKTYPDSVSFTTKPTWSDRDANKGGERLTACATEGPLIFYEFTSR